MAPRVSKFSDGERILCFHGPLMYEAKCMKAELRDENKGYYYLVHYNGWNKHWDEWVPETRVLKYNNGNLQRQKDLLKQHGKDKTKRGRPSKLSKIDNGKETTPKSSKKLEAVVSTSEPKKKRLRSEATVESEEAYLAKVEVEINIPGDLKAVLLDDWDLITRQKHLFRLPAKVTIEEILRIYVEKGKSDNSNEHIDSLRELVAGIKEYFNVMLGAQLLYKFERAQYEKIVSKCPDLTMIQIYGMPHLLRFFAKVGSILSYTNLNEQNMHTLTDHMQAFLEYLNNNQSLFFDSSEYEPPCEPQTKPVNA